MDDIEKLKENSQLDSIYVYIDSSKRDLQYYPFPGEYTITFDQPFKNVYGFEVLDGAIPNTMYNVDKYNNDLYLTSIKPGSSITNDNIIINYFNEIKTAQTFITAFNSDIETFFIVGNISQTSPWLTATIDPDDVIESQWYLVTRNILNNPGIINYANQINEEYYIFTWINNRFCIPINNNTQLTISILELNNFALILNNYGSYDLIYFIFNRITFSMYTAIDSAQLYYTRISNFHKYLAIGNTDVITIVNDLNDLLSPFDIGCETTTVVPSKEGKLQFTCSYPFIINSNRGALSESLGFDIYPSAYDDNTCFLPTFISDNYQLFLSVYDEPNLQWIVKSPGLINLLGERFVILRIPELEDHIYGSYSYMDFTPGLGMFKMGSSGGGITNLRFDFTTVIKKPFHPIGKLSKITLRWETKSGMMYDFKGVNHQMLFTVKCYSVSNKGRILKESIINPNYNPDFMKYMSNNKSIQYHEASDDEESFDDDNYQKLYNKHLEKLDYYSSDDGLIDYSLDDNKSDESIN